MKTVVRHLFTAVFLALVGITLFAGAIIQRQVAEGQRHVATLDLNRAAQVLDALSEQLRFTEPIPWLLRDTRREIESRRAAVRYWRREYGALVTAYPDVGEPGIRENRTLQLTLANAYVRNGEATANGDRLVLLGELDRAINVHLQVLQNTDGDRHAAFNYEYLIRLRNNLAGGAEIQDRGPRTPLGRPGNTEEMDMEDINEMKVYVPTDLLDREASDEPTLGSDAPLRRRG
jgi:hypothetical protein